SDPSHVVMTSVGILKSTDGGKTWHLALKSRTMFGPVAWAASASQIAYAVGFDRSFWRSSDGGNTWAKLSGTRLAAPKYWLYHDANSTRRTWGDGTSSSQGSAGCLRDRDRLWCCSSGRWSDALFPDGGAQRAEQRARKDPGHRERPDALSRLGREEERRQVPRLVRVAVAAAARRRGREARSRPRRGGVTARGGQAARRRSPCHVGRVGASPLCR